MRINKKIKEDFDRMVWLDIPRKKRREYIKGVYSCFRTLSFYPKIFNYKLNELLDERTRGEYAVLEIDKMFEDLIKISTQNFNKFPEIPSL